MKITVLYPLLGFLALHLCAGLWSGTTGGVAYTQNDWKQEFTEVCGKAQNVMELSPDALRSYIDRCARLESRIDELIGGQGSEKKVYAKRLAMCKDLFVYALEFKEKKD